MSTRVHGLALVLDGPLHGGIETYVRDLMEVSSSSIDWELVAIRRGSAYANVEGLRRAVAAARARPSIILADRLRIAPYAATARRAAGGTPRLIVCVYGSELISTSKRRSKMWSARRASALLACSDWTAEAAREALDHRGEIQVVRPGVRIEEWRRPEHFDSLATRSELGLPTTSMQLVSTARLETNARHKGIDRSIAALQLLRARGIHAHFVLVGGGSDHDWIDSLAADHGVTDAVYRMGTVDADMLRRLLWCSDIFTLPSLPEMTDRGAGMAEGFGIALLEAAASGLPVVATGAAGSGEAFEHGVTGLRVSGTPTSIADAIEALTLGRAALDRGVAERWLARFDWSGRHDEVVGALLGARDPAD